MAVADDGGAQVSLTRGKTFSTYYNQPTAELYGVAVDNQFPYRVYGAQQDNTGISVPIWSSSNAIYPKQDWQYPAACETGPIALHPDQPHIVWGGCYGGAINRMNMRTDERRNVIAYPQLQLGQAAKDLKYRFQWVAPIVVSPHDANTVYHGAQKVLRTRDGGMTWDEISGDLTTRRPHTSSAAAGPSTTTSRASRSTTPCSRWSYHRRKPTPSGPAPMMGACTSRVTAAAAGAMSHHRQCRASAR